MKCAKIQPADEPRVERDRAFEQAFLDQVRDRAQRQAGIDATAFVDLVKHRLDLGSRVYGDRNLQDRSFDHLAEALEEPCDATAYSLMEMTARNFYDDDEGGGALAYHLLEAAVHGAILDHHLRRARSYARGVVA